MLYSIWRWIQMWIIPFGLLIQMNKGKDVLPSNIKLRNGRKLKALMITNDYGILFSEEKYTEHRLKKLLAQQRYISDLNVKLTAEINDLSIQQKEFLLNMDDE